MKKLIGILTMLLACQAFALDGVQRNVQWIINPSTGAVIGYRNPLTDKDDTTFFGGGAGNPAGSSGDWQKNSGGVFGAFTPAANCEAFIVTPTAANFLLCMTNEASLNVGSATALAANGTNCSAGSYPLGVDASGNAESCTAVGSGTDADAIHDNVSGEINAVTAKTSPVGADLLLIEDSAASNAKKKSTVAQVVGSSNAATATALAANGTNCSAGQYARGVDASGNAENCTAASGSGDMTAAVYDPGNKAAQVLVEGDVASYNGTFVASTTLLKAGTVDGSDHPSTVVPAVAGTDYVAPAGNAATATALATNGSNCSAGQYPLGVDASGAVESCTADDDTPQANAITDAMLATTHEECFPLYTPGGTIADTYDIQSVWRAPVAVTVTEVWCETDTGTVNLDLQIDDGTPADIMGTDLVCASTAVSDSTGLTGSMAAGDRIDFAITSVASSPTRLTACIVYTR